MHTPQIRDENILKIERQVYNLSFSGLRGFIQRALGLPTWPGDFAVMSDLLTRFEGTLVRNDQNRLITVYFSLGDWTHQDALTAVFKAFVYHVLLYHHYNS